ncbi:PH domain-containing protein [Prauserella shujinwangii]|uniref:PH domain-containing protein n=1 Tax=Prauserella shujinwangii TaxID=1453103 RepID=UPI0015E5E997|nr:PH domain-containing protein [Prauserella shujinwangii]
MAWLLGLAALAGALFTGLVGDRPGALLFGVGAVAALAAAAHGTLVRPRLTADAEGLHVRTLGRSHRLGWAEVRLELATTRRFGRDVTVLEVEGADLVVLGRLELGADPRDVYDHLMRLRTG